MLVISWWNACAKIIFGLSEVQWTSSHALEVPGQTPLTAPAASVQLATSWGRRGPEPPQGLFALRLCCAQGPSCPALAIQTSLCWDLKLGWNTLFITQLYSKGLLLWCFIFLLVCGFLVGRLFLVTTHGMWDLSSPCKDQTCAPTLGVYGLLITGLPGKSS